MTLREFLTLFRRDQLVEVICVIADKNPFVGKMLKDWANKTMEELNEGH